MSFNYTVSWYVGAVRSCANNIFYLKKFLSDCCFIRLFNHIGVRNLSYEFSCITTIIIKSSSTRRLPMASKVWYGYVEIRLSLYKCCKNLMIDCYKCTHYYVTWDKKFPHGCKAMGFKSKQFPSAMVRLSSGRECLLFTKKRTNKKQKTSRNNFK